MSLSWPYGFWPYSPKDMCAKYKGRLLQFEKKKFGNKAKTKKLALISFLPQKVSWP
jgi:penicillin-binding protein-related factor A (putative recombinase)